MTDRLGVFPHGMDGRRQTMRTPDEVAAMHRLHDLGWGTRRIAAEMGCNRETVQRNWRRVVGRHVEFRHVPVFWPGIRSGWPSGSGVIVVMPT